MVKVVCYDLIINDDLHLISRNLAPPMTERVTNYESTQIQNQLWSSDCYD